MSEEPSVYLYENGYGEIIYQPILPYERRLWKPYDECFEEKAMKWRTTMSYFSGVKPVLYFSKKEALNIARRQMQKEEQEKKSIFYPKGKETTDDEGLKED